MGQINLFSDLRTPCFILDKAELERSIKGFGEALHYHFSRYTVGYSVKTNSVPYCLKAAGFLGCYAEVVSSDVLRQLCIRVLDTSALVLVF